MLIVLLASAVVELSAILCFFINEKFQNTSRTHAATWGRKWKRINHKQSARLHHISRLKASAFLIEFFLLGMIKHNNLYLRLVTPSGG